MLALIEGLRQIFLSFPQTKKNRRPWCFPDRSHYFFSKVIFNCLVCPVSGPEWPSKLSPRFSFDPGPGKLSFRNKPDLSRHLRNFLVKTSLPLTPYHLPLTTYHLTPTTNHLPLTTFHLPPTTFHLPPTTYHLTLTTYHCPELYQHFNRVHFFSWDVGD